MGEGNAMRHAIRRACMAKVPKEGHYRYRLVSTNRDREKVAPRSRGKYVWANKGVLDFRP